MAFRHPQIIYQAFYTTKTVGLQAIHCIMDSRNVMKMKSGEKFVAINANVGLLTVRAILISMFTIRL